MDKKHAVLGRAALLCATLIWGSSFIILKSALDSVPVLWLLSLRFMGGALFMFAIGAKHLKTIDKKCLRYGVELGVTLYLAFAFQTFGLKYTTPGKNAFLTATYCVLVPFIRWLIFKKRPEIRNVTAAVVCVAGMGFVSLSGDFSVGIGDSLTMVCGIFYALQIIILSEAVAQYSAMVLSAIEFLVGGTLCLITAPFTEPFPAHIPGSAWLSILYLCLLCTCVCFVLQAYGQRYTSPETTAIILTLESVFGAVLSVIFYHEHLTLRVITGFVLIFAAVLISELRLNASEKQPDADFSG